ncbi:hypothetical protein CKO09_02915 [Chromatium weissei]|nr:hypothetical protein [Chromatium weissei]
MSQFEKLLAQMRRHPHDWQIKELQQIADRVGIAYRQPGTSHVTFSIVGYAPVVVPAHKPIKPLYIKRFIALVDSVRGVNDNQ